MSHYLRLVKLFVQTAMQREMAFSANFFINLLNTVLNLVAGISGVAILFDQVETIQGWTFPQALALLGVYLLISALQSVCIGPSLEALGGLYGEVLSGRFDFTLLKPVHIQFLVSFRDWRPWAFGDLTLSLGVLGIALAELGEQLSVLNLVTFLIALTVSMTIVYAILLLLASAIFWYQGVPLLWIFDYLMQMGRYPVGIYPGWLRSVLTWVVPIGFITTVPVEALIGQGSAVTLMSGAALALSLLVLASVFFRASLRRYVGASS
jgi:ABC-2 type transport system permease protein